MRIYLLAALALISLNACSQQGDTQHGTAAAPAAGSPAAAASPAAAPGITHQPPAAFQEMLRNTAGVQLLDVRTPPEYADGHLENSRNVDFNGADFDTQIAGLDKTKPVAVYCAIGGRSGKAAEKLKNQGYTVYNLQGGYIAWSEQGLPTAK